VELTVASDVRFGVYLCPARMRPPARSLRITPDREKGEQPRRPVARVRRRCAAKSERAISIRRHARVSFKAVAPDLTADPPARV
jgi:hypothetical protein